MSGPRREIFAVTVRAATETTGLFAACESEGVYFPASSKHLALEFASSSGPDDEVRVGYLVDFPDQREWVRVTARVEGCARLVERGLGAVPPEQRTYVRWARDQARALADALTELLEAGS